MIGPSASIVPFPGHAESLPESMFDTGGRREEGSAIEEKRVSRGHLFLHPTCSSEGILPVEKHATLSNPTPDRGEDTAVGGRCDNGGGEYVAENILFFPSIWTHSECFSDPEISVLARILRRITAAMWAGEKFFFGGEFRPYRISGSGTTGACTPYGLRIPAILGRSFSTILRGRHV